MKIDYRPDIDGLRAISVIAVIFYHANFTFYDVVLFKGGYLGVDIFFVISGYLITSLIFKELQKTRKFSFVNFYHRRARRILPMLLFIILFFIPFAWFYLLPTSLVEFSNSIFFSTFFTSNFFFNIEGHSYGNSLSITKPFLHTWSLSVEEQFYIIFPLFFIFCFKYFKDKIITILLFISLTSLFLAHYGSFNFSITNFYLLPTRLWEIFCGSILAVIGDNKRIKPNFSNFLALLGLFVILFSFYFFTDETLHPSLKTLLPILGTMLIIRFSKKNFTYKILSQKYLVYIGLISYSLYLWHYPIFSFSELLGFQNSNINKIFIIFLSFCLSISSFFLIEKKFRNKSLISNKVFITYLVISISVISIFSYLVFKEKGFSNRAQIIFVDEFKEKPWELLKVDNEICHLRINNFCNINPNSKKGSVFLVGDSHLVTFAKPLADNLIKRDFNFVPLTNGGCYFFPNFDYIDYLTQKVMFGCNVNYQNKRLDLISKKEKPIVIIGGNLNRYLSNVDINNIKSSFIFHDNDDLLSESLISSIRDLLNRDVKVILIYPIPEIPWDPLSKIFQSSNSRNFKQVLDFISNNKISISYEDYFTRSKKSFETLDKINHKNLFKIYPHLIFCNDLNGKNCPIHNDKNIFYYDSEHLSIVGATLLQESILKVIDNLNY